MKEEMMPLRRRIMALVREILGPVKPEIEVRFCTVSILSQCVIPAFINIVEKPETDVGNESLRIDEIEAYAEHVVTFSLAGMAAIGRNILTVTGTSKTAPNVRVYTKVQGRSMADKV